MKRTIILLFLVWAIFAYALPVAWINEIHYDNVGVDHDEFVEVVVLNPENYYLDDIALYMVNGLNGKSYCVDTVQEFELGERIGNYQFYIWYHKGIQNGYDGMHFVFKDTLLDILAYEGSFVGFTEPSTGLVFPDIKVCENSDSPDSCSIYLSGSKGSNWVYGTATPGYCNPGQCIDEYSSAISIDQFRAKTIHNKTVLIWNCSNDHDLLSFRIYKNSVLLANISKKSENTTQAYSYVDTSRFNFSKNTYILSSIHLSGDETYLDTLICSLPPHRDIGLGTPFPNPFNPELTIPFNLEYPSKVEIKLIDLSGKCVYSYVNPMHPSGQDIIKVNLCKQASGIYIIRYQDMCYKHTKRAVLIK